MATASDGAGEKFEKPPGMPSDQGGTSASIPDATELEQILKQVTVSSYKIQGPATMDDLPDELLINIFIRLLVKQLAQMKSVCKNWNAILSHPSFVKSHLCHSIRNNNQQILFGFTFHAKPLKQYSCNSPHLEPINFIKHIPTNLPMLVIGAVNGLICLYSRDYYSNIHIWNPSLSAVSPIPPPHPIPLTSNYISISIRFGFDPKTDDYKLVKILGICNDDYFSVKEWVPVEVYSMRKGCWEFITQPFPSRITSIYSSDHVCVDGHDGHLHWLNETGPWREHTILAFDLGSKTFREIPLPDSILNSNHRLHKLGVLGGKLRELSWPYYGACEVWVMEEYGVHESWAKRHVFLPV